MSIRRPANVADVHDTAGSMPHVRVLGEGAKVVYQVGGKSFVFFRNPRPDAVDGAGVRLDDVIVIWVASEEDKRALVLDEGSPYFSTQHFDGHLSVLVRASRLGEVESEEVRELVQDAWLSRASARRGRTWLESRNVG